MIDARISLSIIILVALVGMISILIDMTREDDSSNAIITKTKNKQKDNDTFEADPSLFDD